jgi:chromosome segregation ATPase|tara:strand:- start:1155 stop:2420 length:1266 start_codon:yes stop_codon:yes gene_type:complete
MALGSSTSGGIHRISDSTGDERAALEGMLRAYPVDQLVEEVLVAWQELADRNEDLVTSKQRLRVLELDLAERKDEVAPEVAQLRAVESQIDESSARIIHLERLLEDTRNELEESRSGLSVEERASLENEAMQLRELTTQQDEVIGEMEGRMAQMVEALERAADAGLTSVTADEVRALKSQADSLSGDLESEKAANNSLEEERQRLRDIADRLRGLLDARDKRLAELEEQIERVMQGPRSVSAEHDYLVEQIEELKRRLLERNREYESLRRRERRLHNDVFERDERIQQMSLTVSDFESALTDRTSEVRELESQRNTAVHELDGVRRTERTREVVGRVFADSLSLVRTHDERELKKEIYANSPDVERKLSTPDTEDMHTLAEGGKVDLETALDVIEKGMDVDRTPRPDSPGGTGDPVLYDED